MDISKMVRSIVESKKEAGGIKQVYFVGCGGSLGAFVPAWTFMGMEACGIRTGLFNSGEFIHSIPRAFGKNTVLVVASHKGNTPETVEAARLGRELGATVIGLVYLKDTPLHDNCDYIVDYTFGPGKDIGGEKVIEGLKVAVEILNQTEGYEHYADFYTGVSMINGIVGRACHQVEKRAQAFAEEYKGDSVFYTMGSGAGYGAAYMESICIFMEMQWINSSSIHTGEFFHGPFEITDDNTPFFIQLSEGKTRAIDERALTFLRRYGKRIELLDAKELGLSSIPSTVVDYFNHSLFNNVYAVYNEALAAARQHPLTTRRYMWKVEY